jgi:hypothetical protein
MAVDLNTPKMSFSNGVVKLNDKIYTAIGNISATQGVDRSAVYGTGRAPQGKSAGQVQLGEGSLTFTDLVEAHEFYSDLRDTASDASLATFACEYTLSDGVGNVVSYELVGCNLTEFSFEHENGADALTIDMPFDFLRMKVDGVANVAGRGIFPT